MFQSIKQLFGRTPAAPAASIPAGQRVYAIGDIHGRLDLFQEMIAAIEADNAALPAADSLVILLGDLMDRGADSAGVIDRARRWQMERPVRILGGNHEEMFLRSFEERELFRHFLRHGGRETVLSYGIDPKAFERATLEEAQEMMRQCVPDADIDFVQGFEEMVQVGDYLFVHAGIEPGIPLEEQASHHLRWIREPFLSHVGPHGVVVVHGHTISDLPEDRGNRIGIDTGAYRSGRLTGLVLEGTTRRYLEVTEHESGALVTSALAA